MGKQELINDIARIYGFKKELIQDVSSCGLWHVRFTVNGIKYYGNICHSGAEPMLHIEGYTYKYYWQGCPVTEAYYKEHIEGRILHLRKCADADCGEWEWLEKTFETEEEAVTYIKTLKNPEMYGYDIRYD